MKTSGGAGWKPPTSGMNHVQLTYVINAICWLYHSETHQNCLDGSLRACMCVCMCVYMCVCVHASVFVVVWPVPKCPNNREHRDKQIYAQIFYPLLIATLLNVNTLLLV